MFVVSRSSTFLPEAIDLWGDFGCSCHALSTCWEVRELQAVRHFCALSLKSFEPWPLFVPHTPSSLLLPWPGGDFNDSHPHDPSPPLSYAPDGSISVKYSRAADLFDSQRRFPCKPSRRENTACYLPFLHLLLANTSRKFSPLQVRLH